MSTKKYPLMPKATAVWLIENTALTFKQIGEFCGIHELEIKGIADGEVASSVMAVDPVTSGQLSQEEIEKCSKNPEASLKLQTNATYDELCKKKKKVTKYTPIARRQDKPDAALWLLKNIPDIKDADVIKLIGTSKSTLESIKTKAHWNMTNIVPKDPVLLGLCSQADLNNIQEKTRLANENK